jgi:hypothetical protein
MNDLLQELKNRGCEKIVDLRESARFELKSIDCGIVFVIANWSGPAKIGLFNLADAIATCAVKPKVILVDIDKIDVAWLSAFFHRNKKVSALHGFGEILLVKDGKILKQSTRLHEQNQSELHDLLELLSI